MTVKIYSYGTKFMASKPREVAAADTYDCRVLSNPYAVHDLRPLDGTHWKIQVFVKNSSGYTELMNPIFDALEDGKTFAFFCYGGSHRSVVCAEDVASRCESMGLPFEIYHRVLGKNRKG